MVNTLSKTKQNKGIERRGAEIDVPWRESKISRTKTIIKDLIKEYFIYLNV